MGKRNRSKDSQAGIDDGQQIILENFGEPGIRGGQRGDLYVRINVRWIPSLYEGIWIFTSIYIDYPTAVLGGDEG